MRLRFALQLYQLVVTLFVATSSNCFHLVAHLSCNCLSPKVSHVNNDRQLVG